MSRPLGWGIIGLGKHVEQRAGPALRQAAQSRLVAVCSRSLEKAREFARKYEAARAYDSFEGMLGHPVMGAGLHPIDLRRFLLGREVEEVRAGCEPQPPPVDDIIHAILRFANGAC